MFLGFRWKVCCKMVHSDADSKSSDADSNSSAIPVLLNSNSKKYKKRTLLSSTPTLTDCRGLLEWEWGEALLEPSVDVQDEGVRQREQEGEELYPILRFWSFVHQNKNNKKLQFFYQCLDQIGIQIESLFSKFLDPDSYYKQGFREQLKIGKGTGQFIVLMQNFPNVQLRCVCLIKNKDFFQRINCQYLKKKFSKFKRLQCETPRIKICISTRANFQIQIQIFR